MELDNIQIALTCEDGEKINWTLLHVAVIREGLFLSRHPHAFIACVC
jgi:hypothetical protein